MPASSPCRRLRCLHRTSARLPQPSRRAAEGSSPSNGRSIARQALVCPLSFVSCRKSPCLVSPALHLEMQCGLDVALTYWSGSVQCSMLGKPSFAASSHHTVQRFSSLMHQKHANQKILKSSRFRRHVYPQAASPVKDGLRRISSSEVFGTIVQSMLQAHKICSAE